jgi:hypothetical protein
MPLEPLNEPKETISRFEKLLVALARAGVDYAVVGGFAVILNGYPRVTVDVDIVVGDSRDNLHRLLDALSGWGEGWARELRVEDFTVQEGAIRVMEDFDLDIFTRMRGKSLQDFRPRLRYLEAGDVRIPYLAPQDLILLKEGSWREKDQLDVAAMRRILGLAYATENSGAGQGEDEQIVSRMPLWLAIIANILSGAVALQFFWLSPSDWVRPIGWVFWTLASELNAIVVLPLVLFNLKRLRGSRWPKYAILLSLTPAPLGLLVERFAQLCIGYHWSP